MHDSERLLLVRAAAHVAAVLSVAEESGRTPAEIALVILRIHCDVPQGELAIIADWIVSRTQETGRCSDEVVRDLAGRMIRRLGGSFSPDLVVASIREMIADRPECRRFNTVPRQ